jgi:hypothetical protein
MTLLGNRVYSDVLKKRIEMREDREALIPRSVIKFPIIKSAQH